MSSKWKNRNSLAAAFGGVAISVLGGAFSPAFASPYTDINGVTCDTSQLVGTQGGPSVCPGGTTKPTTPPTPTPITQPGPFHFQPRTLGTFGDLSLSGLYGDTPPPGTPGAGAPNQLGMYVTPDGSGTGATFGAGGFSARNSGVSISDSAGLLAPGSRSTAFHETSGSGGIGGSFDASSLTGPGQKLIFSGNFDYTSAGTGYAGGGALNSNTYGFRGSALYSNYSTYFKLAGGYQIGNGSETAVGGSSGNYNTNGYFVDSQLGHVFALFNTTGPATPARITKSPLPVSDAYAIGLDLSGHLGYASDTAQGFTDSSGFAFGNERAQGGMTGLNATLFASVPGSGFVWEPYVAASFDWRFDYSHIAYYPLQAALPTGDAVRFSDATTFLGVQGGVNVKASNGWLVGVSGFYLHSADTDVLGGKVFLNIPLDGPTVVARY